ncbi:MAG TPA: DUF2905 domain-containing protein [Tepidisphaeraceae bacterium]|nr:DUF2905 domain-containing protein [Tepidisphaeraceae bacterium]
MAEMGKLLVFSGLLIALAGAAVWCLARRGFHGLPGDIRYETEHVRVYFPVVTCLVLSAALTGLMWLWHRLIRR